MFHIYIQQSYWMFPKCAKYFGCSLSQWHIQVGSDRSLEWQCSKLVKGKGRIKGNKHNIKEGKCWVGKFVSLHFSYSFTKNQNFPQILLDQSWHVPSWKAQYQSYNNCFRNIVLIRLVEEAIWSIIFSERNSNGVILTSRFLMKMLVPFEYNSFFPVGSAFSTVGLPLVVFGTLAKIASVGQKIFNTSYICHT